MKPWAHWTLRDYLDAYARDHGRLLAFVAWLVDIPGRYMARQDELDEEDR